MLTRILVLGAAAAAIAYGIGQYVQAHLDVIAAALR